MGLELIVLALGTLGISSAGVIWWTQRTARDFINRVRTEWVRAGQIIRWGPVGAVCYGTRPPHRTARDVFGAIGIAGGRTEGHLIFHGRRTNRYDASIAPNTVRWIGLGPVARDRVPSIPFVHGLSIHTEGPDGWRVYTYVAGEQFELAQVLSQLVGLPVHDSGSARQDFGPARAERTFQDIYGEWTPDRSADLYLAPDRLLFDWRDAIPLRCVRRLDALRQHDRRPLAADLLRVEYEDEDGETAVVGFVVRRAEQWAGEIQRRMDTPIPVFAGRKKKAD